MEDNIIALREPVKTRPAWKDIVYGSFAGMCARLVEHPFDLVKVRLQSQPIDRPLVFKGPLDCLSKTFTNEGIRGLYRGLSMPMSGAMAETATLFLVYNQTQALLRSLRFQYTGDSSALHRPLGPLELALSGAAAGSAASLILTPVELIKCRMQVQFLAMETRNLHLALDANLPDPAKMPKASFATLEGPVALIRRQVKTEGFRGLWLGQTGTFIREAGGTAAWFLANEGVTKFFVKRKGPNATKADLASWQYALGGVCAGISYTLSLFPADSIKSSIQTHAELTGTAPKAFLATGREIFRARGLKGLYSGCGITCFKSACSSALVFVIYSNLERRFG